MGSCAVKWGALTKSREPRPPEPRPDATTGVPGRTPAGKVTAITVASGSARDASRASLGFSHLSIKFLQAGLQDTLLPPPAPSLS